ncbi:hypothetical protein PQR64_10360 [Paraburkholderia phytofirmans]|uniref:hypothetical protein n=1 Tax=Paraburkholderia phytofirmans TaxID=261302 RepID=UPI0038B8CD18
MFDKLMGVVMKVRSIAALLVASSALLAASAFAGGNDQTPSYRSDVAASASHRGQTAQAKAAAEGHGSVVDVNHSGVGGSESGKSQSGRRAPGDSINPMYHGG